MSPHSFPNAHTISSSPSSTPTRDAALYHAGCRVHLAVPANLVTSSPIKLRQSAFHTANCFPTHSIWNSTHRRADAAFLFTSSQKSPPPPPSPLRRVLLRFLSLRVSLHLLLSSPTTNFQLPLARTLPQRRSHRAAPVHIASPPRLLLSIFGHFDKLLSTPHAYALPNCASLPPNHCHPNSSPSPIVVHHRVPASGPTIPAPCAWHPTCEEEVVCSRPAALGWLAALAVEEEGGKER